MSFIKKIAIKQHLPTLYPPLSKLNVLFKSQQNAHLMSLDAKVNKNMKIHVL